MKHSKKTDYIYQKYINPALNREKSIKKEHIKNWFKKHIFDILNLFIAILALIVALQD